MDVDGSTDMDSVDGNGPAADEGTVGQVPESRARQREASHGE